MSANTDLYIDINMTPSGVSPRVHLSQYDKGRRVVCNMYDNNGLYTIPEGATATVEGTKADNTGFQYDCEIVGNEVTFTITDQMTIFEGEVEFEIVLRHEGFRQGSANCIFVVENAGLQKDIQISKTDLPLLQEIIGTRDEVRELDKEVKEIKKEIDDSKDTIIKDIEDTGDEYLSDLETARTGALSDISGAKGEALDAISKDRSDAQTAIAEDKADALGAIATDKADAVEAIGNTKDSAIADIEKSGEDNAKLSKSYAVGGTGIREGEDTDNSEYYAKKSKEYMEQASILVDVGFASDTHAGLAKGDGVTIHASGIEGGGKLSLTEKYANHPDATFYDNKVHGLSYDPVEESLFLTTPDGSEIELGGGGSGGAMLTVYAPKDSEVSILGRSTGRSDSAVVGDSGSVRFKIREYDIYDITSKLGKKKDTREINIDTSKAYTETMTYWIASINATCNMETDFTITPNEMVDKESARGDSAVFEIYEADTYTVTAKNDFVDGKGRQYSVIKSDEIEVSAQKAYDAVFNIETATLTITYPKDSDLKLTKGDLEYVGDKSGKNTFVLHSMGQYNAVITDGSETATMLITVNDKDAKTVPMAYFSATIKVNHAPTNAYKIRYEVDGEQTEIPTDASGVTDITVPKKGSYTVSILSNGTQSSATQTASIQNEGETKELTFGYATLNISTSETGGEITVTDSLSTAVLSVSEGLYFPIANFGNFNAVIVTEGKKGESNFTLNVGGTENVTLKYFSATITVIYPEGSECTFKYPSGQSVPVTDNPQIFTVWGKGTYTASCHNDEEGKQKEGSFEVTTDGQEGEIKLVYEQIYGIMRDRNSSSPEWTRTKNAEGLMATPTIGDSIGHSDFDEIYPWSEMKPFKVGEHQECYVKIPRFYYRRYLDGETEHIEIAPEQYDGFELHPAFLHSSGGIGVAQYVCTYQSGKGGYLSLPGHGPRTGILLNSVRSDVMRQENVSVLDIATWSALQMLILVEYASYNVQEVIASDACGNNSRSLNTGETVNMKGHTGTTNGSSDKVLARYRYIEGLWGNVRIWVDGISLYSSHYRVTTDPSKYGVTNEYTPLSYENGGGGWGIKMGYDPDLPWCMFESESKYDRDYSNEYITDRNWNHKDTQYEYVLAFGGECVNGTGKQAGMFSSEASTQSSNRNWVSIRKVLRGV